MDMAFSQVRELGSMVLFQRSAAGLTQEELADRSGLSVRTIRDIERGHTTTPSATSIRLLAKALEHSEARLDGLVTAAAMNRVQGLMTTPPARPNAFVAPAVRPAQTPAAVADFTGREPEAAALRQMLVTDSSPNAGAAIAAVTGMPGVGKTALALRVAHQVAAQFPDGQLYANLGGRDNPVPAREVILRFLHDLGAAPGDIPSPGYNYAGRYQSWLAGKRLLIVLDDVSDAEQARQFVPGSARCGILITSRNRLADLEGARPILLTDLPAADAHAMLAGITGPDRLNSEPGEASAVLFACAGLPLAIRIAGARLASRPHWPVATLAARFRRHTKLLDELRLGDLSVSTSLQQCFNTLLRLGDNGRQAQTVFRVIGQLNCATFTAGDVSSIMGLADQDIERLLEILVDSCLLEATPTDSYHLHPLTRLFSLSIATRGASNRPRRAERTP